MDCATIVPPGHQSCLCKACVRPACAREAKPRATQPACTIYTILHTLIDVHRSYVPFWLLGVVGADLRPDSWRWYKQSVNNLDDCGMDMILMMRSV
jgi:hypothetical protein